MSENGIEEDPKKVEIVADWPRPTTMMEIKSFLGLADKRFVSNFSKIVAPMMRLTQKNEKFEWSVECEESFQKLKECLISALVMVLPTEN